MSGVVRDIDLGWNKIMQNMKKLDNTAVKVGIQSGETTEDGEEDLAYIAGVHEFGSSDGHIPQRSFLRTAIDNNEGEIEKLKTSLAGKIVDGSVNPKNALELIGQKVTGMIQENITDGHFVPNAPSTVRAKGSDKPLIDTGHMRNSVRHVLE